MNENNNDEDRFIDPKYLSKELYEYNENIKKSEELYEIVEKKITVDSNKSFFTPKGISNNLGAKEIAELANSLNNIRKTIVECVGAKSQIKKNAAAVVIQKQKINSGTDENQTSINISKLLSIAKNNTEHSTNNENHKELVNTEVQETLNDNDHAMVSEYKGIVVQDDDGKKTVMNKNTGEVINNYPQERLINTKPLNKNNKKED